MKACKWEYSRYPVYVVASVTVTDPVPDSPSGDEAEGITEVDARALQASLLSGYHENMREDLVPIPLNRSLLVSHLSNANIQHSTRNATQKSKTGPQ